MRRGPLALLLVSLAWSSVATAQPEDRRAAAQALFEQGKALVEVGRFKEACPKLADSQRLDPGIGTSLWLADCYENAGQTASAWAQFKEAAAAAAMGKDPREKVARQRAEALEKKLSRLTISKNPAAKSVIVRRDGVEVGPSEIGNPLPVDPGTHEITASAPGMKTWRATVDVAPESTNAHVVVPALERDPSSGPSATPPSPSEEPSDGSAQRAIGLAVAGVGVVATGIGAFFAFDAKGTYDDSNANGHCIDNRCDDDGKSLRHDAESKATVATITIGAGAAAIVAGAVLFFVAPRSQKVGVRASSLVVRF